jgi:hypothetical protein
MGSLISKNKRPKTDAEYTDLVKKYVSDENNNYNTRDYIKNIISSKEFNDNHYSYMSKWARDRGASEEYRIPEDYAREVIRKMINDGVFD